MFLSKWFKIIFLVVITLSSFLALWSFSTVGGSRWSTNLPLNIGPFRICSDAELHDTLVPANPGCLASYRFCLFLFALIVVPLSCLELKELGYIQAILGISRVASIILYCLAKLAESPLIEHTIPSNSTFNQSGPDPSSTPHAPVPRPPLATLSWISVWWVGSSPSLCSPMPRPSTLASPASPTPSSRRRGSTDSWQPSLDIDKTASLNWVRAGVHDCKKS